jgi:Tol biopolymer transport system component
MLTLSSEHPAGGEAARPDYSLAPATGRMVFQSYRSGSGDIYRMDPLGTTLVRLTTSVDGGRLASSAFTNRRWSGAYTR